MLARAQPTLPRLSRCSPGSWARQQIASAYLPAPTAQQRAAAGPEGVAGCDQRHRQPQHPGEMLASPRRPPGHAQPDSGVEAVKAAATAAALPPTPQRMQGGSDRLVALTTSNVLAVPRQHHELVGLPLGAILSPSPSHALPNYALDPASCSKCGAYINVYSPASGDRGEWHCNFCLHLNTTAGTPLGSARPSLDLESSTSSSLLGPSASGALPPSAYVTPPTAPTLGPALSREASATAASPLQPLLQQEAVDYITPHGEGGSAAAAAGLTGAWALPVGSSTSAGGVAVVVVDTVASFHDLEVVRGALLQAAAALPDSARVALLASSATAVAAYRLAGPGAEATLAEGYGAASDVLPGNLRAGDAELLRVLRPGVHVVPAGACRAALQAAILSLRPHSAAAAGPRCIPAAVEAALHLCQLPQLDQPGPLQHSAQQAPSGAVQPPAGEPQSQQMDRAAGTRPPGHVVVVTTGRASQGYSGLTARRQQEAAAGGEEEDEEEEETSLSPTALQLVRAMSQLANRAALAGVTVDILSAGADPDHIPAISPLAQGTAGLFVQQRHADDAFSANIAAAVRRPAGLTATLEVRTSSGLAVRDTYGAVVPLFAAGRPTEQWEALTGDAAPPPPRWLNRRTWHYRCTPPSDSQGVTLVLHCDRPPPQTYVYMQVVWSWVDEGGHRVRRIVTRRLHTTHNPTAEVEALNPEVAAAVWAKTLIAQALEKGGAFDRKEAEIIRRSLGKRLFEFVSRFGFPVESSRGWFSGPTQFVLPPAFLPIAQSLFCLHRGPMLLHALGGHPEERALLQAHFMTASLPLSATMAIPTLHLLTFLPSLGAASGKQPVANGTSAAAAAGGTNGKAAPPGAPGALPPLRNGSVAAGVHAAGFAPAPAVDLALYDSLAAVVDHGSHIFVWVHPELSAAEWAAAEAACRAFALRLGAGRMPVPEVVVDARQCLARLTPIQGDSYAQQLAQAPLLAAAHRGLLERVAQQLGPAAEPSLYQWLEQNGLWPEQQQQQ